MNLTRRATYTGPRWLDAAERAAWMVLKAKYPDVYKTPGEGWSGPGWAEFTRAECEILDAAVARQGA